MNSGMDRLFTLFDQKYQEYKDYLDERSWADAALVQSYLQGVIGCMLAGWDKDAEGARDTLAGIVSRRNLIDD